MCAEDLAETRRVRPTTRFHYDAQLSNDAAGQPLAVARQADGTICVTLPHVAAETSGGDQAPERYVRIRVTDGVAEGALVVHLYDLGPTRGFRLAGLERPEP